MVPGDNLKIAVTGTADGLETSYAAEIRDGTVAARGTYGGLPFDLLIRGTHPAARHVTSRGGTSVEGTIRAISGGVAEEVAINGQAFNQTLAFDPSFRGIGIALTAQGAVAGFTYTRYLERLSDTRGRLGGEVGGKPIRVDITVSKSSPDPAVLETLCFDGAYGDVPIQEKVTISGLDPAR